MGLIPGLRELTLIAVVLITLYGRSGALRAILRPGMRPPPGRGPNARAVGDKAPWLSNRVFLFLTVLAATAVAALVITRVWVATLPPRTS
jgi:hypothetical protein